MLSKVYEITLFVVFKRISDCKIENSQIFDKITQ